MQTLDHWQAQVRAVLAGGLRGSSLEPLLDADEAARLAYARTFADDAGHRRLVDPPLLAWVLGVELWETPPTSRRDVLLWAALAEPGTDPLSLIDSPVGPIAPEAREEGIEVWTEIELASLQALWWHRWHGSPSRASLFDHTLTRLGEPCHPVRKRALDHARWLMAELQPDNGTNRPWALATFAELAAGGDTDAALYAETLLHNCQVTLGKPDLLSTVILLDTARHLDRTGPPLGPSPANEP